MVDLYQRHPGYKVWRIHHKRDASLLKGTIPILENPEEIYMNTKKTYVAPHREQLHATSMPPALNLYPR